MDTLHGVSNLTIDMLLIWEMLCFSEGLSGALASCQPMVLWQGCSNSLLIHDFEQEWASWYNKVEVRFA